MPKTGKEGTGTQWTTKYNNKNRPRLITPESYGYHTKPDRKTPAAGEGGEKRRKRNKGKEEEKKSRAERMFGPMP